MFYQKLCELNHCKMDLNKMLNTSIKHIYQIFINWMAKMGLLFVS